MEDKFILDACCGGRHFWFDQKHPNVLYIDNRKCEKGHYPARPNHEVKPDKVVDFRDMPFTDKRFKLVVFDPPHVTQAGETGWIAKKYGVLNKETWRDDLKKGFEECWRVLEDYGILIFKWNETSIKFAEVLKCFDVEPLFGHPTAKAGKTKWFCFMKIPNRK